MINKTKQEIADIYYEASLKIANMISILNELKGSFHWLSNQTMDNADPECDAGECLEHLGVLLSSVVIYADEYKKDALKELSCKKKKSNKRNENEQSV